MDKAERIQYYISIVLKIFIGVLVVISLWRQEFFLAAMSLFVLLLTFLPAIISRSFKIYLPTEIDFFLTLILYLHYALGEYGGFYMKLSWWDLFLHAGNSVILGLIGFVFAYSLFITSRIESKPFFVSVFSLSFAVMVGVLWEIFEFGMDQIFGFSMQKSGLVDTMTDLIVDALGALVISILGFFYIKKPRPGIMHSIINRLSNVTGYIK